jgi:RimJ/RimL family protein N-acetyltransferase
MILRMQIRPLRAADREFLAEAFEGLSPQSRYQRFFAPLPRLTESQLDYLTDVDQRDHVALVAVDEESEELMGVARYVRSGPHAAEPAIVVADRWQGQGVAGRLLARLAQRAPEEQITTFVAPILADNGASIRVFTRLGETTVERHGAQVELTIQLPVTPPRGTAAIRGWIIGVPERLPALAHRLSPRPATRTAGPRNVIVVGTGPELSGDTIVETATQLALPTGAELRRGDLGAMLLDVATESQAKLIVVGDPGGDTGAVGRLLAGPSDHVSHHAPCDVLIARRGAELAHRPVHTRAPSHLR